MQRKGSLMDDLRRNGGSRIKRTPSFLDPQLLPFDKRTLEMERTGSQFKGYSELRPLFESKLILLGHVLFHLT